MNFIDLVIEGVSGRISTEDAEWVSGFRWKVIRPRGRPYFYRDENKKLIYLHREIMARTGHTMNKIEVDHINGESLDNRRENLRLASRSCNLANARTHNSTGFKGVRVNKRSLRNPFVAQITVNYGPRHLGCFPTREDAARAYDKAASEAWGSFARLNFQKD